MINLLADSQATAIKLIMNKRYAICLIYLPHIEVVYE